MPTAGAYINKRRFIAENNVTKVEYPGKVAVNFNNMYAGIRCNPLFQILNYSKPDCSGHTRKICITI
jgi:hypothetical protein